jgi:hypothetical protein
LAYAERIVGDLLLGPNRAPRPAIYSQANGETLVNDSVAILGGGAWDPESGYLSGSQPAWYSNRDGWPGAGSHINVADLSLGDHVITLLATDPHDRVAAVTVAVEVITR